MPTYLVIPCFLQNLVFRVFLGVLDFLADLQNLQRKFSFGNLSNDHLDII
jgi:hypothetical protein